PEDLVRAAASASDAPRSPSGGPAPMAEVVRAVETGLRVLWSSLVPALPLQLDADLRGESRAAQFFRNALEALWKKPRMFEAARDDAGNSVGSSASLLSRVRYQQCKNGGVPGARSKWHRVHPAFSAWWRRDFTPGEGAEVTLLGMRAAVAGPG